MFAIDLGGARCGIVPRTIGGPYAVLVAEQLHEGGVELIVGLTSAGRLAPDLDLPAVVLADSAIRDEGTSYHYLPPAPEVACPSRALSYFARALASASLSARVGKVWTTDAPYRETASQLRRWADDGALAVEMQAASLFAFGEARGADVAVVARVSNAVDYEGGQFDTGSHEQGLALLQAIALGGLAFLADRRAVTSANPERR